MSDFVTGVTALWLPMFGLGSMYLAACAFERVTRPTDPRDLVESAHAYTTDTEGDD